MSCKIPDQGQWGDIMQDFNKKDRIKQDMRMQTKNVSKIPHM